MYFVIYTLGCKVNQYESEAVARCMTEAGHAEAEAPALADIFIINSCTVTAAGDSKTKQLIRSARGTNPGAVIVLTGCFPQAFPEEAGATQADIVTGTAERGLIPGRIAAFLENRERSFSVNSLPESFEELPFSGGEDKTRAYLKIEDGCDRHCAYCIIPTARGNVRSRSPKSIAEEAALLAQNHREIVLTGINLSRYGHDIGLGLCDAVEAVCGVPEPVRVRLSSLEPELLTPAVVERLARQEGLCPHFHLSLQSGCDETLRRMKRSYDTAAYRRIAENLREAFPGAALTTDIMVGFAGETEREFAESLAFVEEMGFARAHVFTYSLRKGTAAAGLPGQVPQKIKTERHKRMQELAERLKQRFYHQLTGTEHTLLVEKRTSPDFIFGHTENYTPVAVYGAEGARHDLLRIKITGAEETRCRGEIVGEIR